MLVVPAATSGANATAAPPTVQLPMALRTPVLPSGGSYSAATGVLAIDVGPVNLNATALRRRSRV